MLSEWRERKKFNTTPRDHLATRCMMMPLVKVNTHTHTGKRAVQRKYALSFRLGIFEVSIEFCQNHTNIQIRGK